MNSNTNKGDFLENVYYMFEKSLRTNKNAILKRKHKLLCSKGVKREIDIYVEIPIDEFRSAKFAVECKNHKNGVSIIHIDSLVAKIKDTPIRGILITSSYFQSGVIEYAKQYDIGLLLFNKLENPNCINEVLLLKNQFSIIDIKVNCNSESKDLMNEINKCPQCDKLIYEMIELSYLNVIIENIELIAKSHDSNWGDISKTNYFSKETGLKTMSNIITPQKQIKCSLQHPFTITHLDFYLSIWKEVLKVDNEISNSYSINQNDKTLASLHPIQFNIGSSKIIGSLIQSDSKNKKGILSVASQLETSIPKDLVSFNISEELMLKIETAKNINEQIN